MDRWYGSHDRRQAIVSMSDVLYRAGTGDTAVVADVARLASDRSHGALIRASAAEFAGQLISKSQVESKSTVAQGFSPAIINALIGASADPEAMVRITAVRALGLVHDQRTTPVIAAHLVDDSRLVRVSAAEALFDRGISRLDGAVEKLHRAAALIDLAQDSGWVHTDTARETSSDWRCRAAAEALASCLTDGETPAPILHEQADRLSLWATDIEDGALR